MTPPGAPGISTSGLAKRFGRGAAITRLLVRAPRHERITALEDVTFALGAGEVGALVGPNGAGKSTLLRVLATLLLPDAGSATVAGHDAATEPVEVRRAMALVTADDRSFSWRLTGRENLEFFAALHGRRGVAARTAVDAALERADLTHASADAFATYSSGMRQRLALARGLTTGARVLLLDEPFRSLDDESSERLRGMLAESAAAGTTALVATHRVEDLGALTTRVIELHGGRLRFDGDLDGWRRARAGDRAAGAAVTGGTGPASAAAYDRSGGALDDAHRPHPACVPAAQAGRGDLTHRVAPDRPSVAIAQGAAAARALGSAAP